MRLELFKKDSKHPLPKELNLFTKEKALEVIKYHESFPEYSITPLVELNYLAKEIGVKNIFVKDESKRFSLNAFKALGGSYGIANEIAKQIGCDIKEITIEKLKSPEIKEKIKDITFITATDGNHGRGIAWTVREIGCKAIIYMPKDTVPWRIEHIEKLGATVIKTDMNFDDTARFAFEESKRNNWVMVQDTTFDNYIDFPTWCMQGYLTMSCEADRQLKEKSVIPTHIFIQAGAGSLAGSVAGYFANALKENPAKLITVEANTCGCIIDTAKANDGKLRVINGDLKTIMAGLSVGEACSVGWDVLNTCAYAYATCDDVVAANGMRILAAPVQGDEAIIAGESGSPGVGTLYEMMTKPCYEEMRNTLGLNEDSVVLCFNTEGDTDPINYKKVVWEGAYGECK